MKRAPFPRPESGPPQYWRSLDHLAEHPKVQEMIEREFPEGASTIDAPTRRTFMTLMGASFAMMGLSGCVRRPEEKIIPYQKMPENLIPGIAQHYASAVAHHGEAVGVLVEAHEGRPTKIEGNVDHPSSLGGTLPYMQAMVLDLYDPDRIQAAQVVTNGSPKAAQSPEVFFNDLAGKLNALEKRDGGSGLRVLIEPTSSPSVARLRRALLQRFPKAKVVEYSPAGSWGARAGAKLAFGDALRAHVAYDKAKVIVSADCDFLFNEPGAVVANRLFARGRKVQRPGDRPSRLYVAEPALSVTGMNADHRLRVPASHVEDFLMALAAELGKKGVKLGDLGARLKPTGTYDAKWLTALAADLAKSQGQSVVVVGSRQSVAAQALGHAINDALGNVGKTVRFTRPTGEQSLDAVAELKALVDDINKKAVDTLVILGSNPVYSAPGDLKFGEALASVPNRFLLASHFDETGTKVGAIFPRAHELESWSDLRGSDGTLSLVQPLIAPMFNGKSDIELLAFMAKVPEQKGHDIVRATFQEVTAGGAAAARAGAAPAATAAAPAATGSAAPAASASASAPAGSASAGSFARVSELAAAALASASASAAGSAAPAASGSAAPAGSASAAASGSAAASATPAPTAPPHEPQAHAGINEKLWRRALHDGLLRGSGDPPADARVNYAAVGAALGKKPAAALSSTNLEVTFSADYCVVDGRFANLAWLQELPNPITKTVWDNAAWISPKLAHELSVESGDVVRLSANGQSIEIPVWIVPGTADYSVQLHLGWGRKMTGRVATPEDGGVRGFNVTPLRTTESFFVATGAKIEKGGASPNHYAVVVTQEHNMLEGRPIVKDATVDEFAKDPHLHAQEIHHPPLLPLWDERRYDGHKWGMVVDLNACTGCGACVVACQAENNIPTVGKEQVARQREMHWLRIDRYFSGDPEDPRVVNQPMACVHCENAPCENVCPVNATSHGPEGLNEMTYNRCIGTRYCSNNCPYKVRRFNFLDYHEDVPETTKMVHNPNVSVRMRGVMEKCTYCVQRIQAAKIAAKRDNRKLKDGDVVSACAQACPAEAIVFGDLNDKSSRVARLTALEHGFRVLEELNTKPHTTYIAKIRNPNPELHSETTPTGSQHDGH